MGLFLFFCGVLAGVISGGREGVTGRSTSSHGKAGSGAPLSSPHGLWFAEGTWVRRSSLPSSEEGSSQAEPVSSFVVGIGSIGVLATSLGAVFFPFLGLPVFLGSFWGSGGAVPSQTSQQVPVGTITG